MLVITITTITGMSGRGRPSACSH